MRPLFLCLAAVLVTACPAHAQYEWRSFAADIDQVALYHDGRQVGAYHLVEDYYRPFDPLTSQWGERGRPPVTPPGRNFGLVKDKIRDGDHYSLNGQEVSKEQIQQVLGDRDRKVPDDSEKLRLTVIGDPSYRSIVTEDLPKHPALAAWKDKIVAVWYPLDHWAIARQGFRIGGQPTLYIQKPDGTVLHRQDDYRGGADALAEVLHKLDPNYQPDKDRDRRKVDLSHWFLPRIPWSVPAVLLGRGAALHFAEEIMIQPEILHVLFVVVGLALGWYLKHQSIKVPPDVLAAVEELLARKQQTQVHTFLQDLLEAVRVADGKSNQPGALAPASPRSPSA